jgi:predicted RNA-binding Zn-ribbon protein involved in translation (DUF1610 family)
MNWIKSTHPFFIIILLGFFGLIFSFYDIIYEKDWMIIILSYFAVLVILTILLIILRLKKIIKTPTTVEEFEKRLEGGLYHFKCPTCNGIFAIKKSKSDNKKPVKMTCPDCGAKGVIPPYPSKIEEEIPEKKSEKVNFRCNNCGEGITVWAEGTNLNKLLDVYSCPFCGNKVPLKKI